jgi:starch synthase (maltosyl-transferring)
LPEGVRIYNLFPPLVGAVDAWKTQLPRIAEMGFNWIYLNPISYPGFSGSLYAVKDYYKLNPMFQGSSSRSMDALVQDFVQAASRHGISVMLDLVVNHTSKDSELALKHPDWFEHESDGSLHSPFALDPGTGQKTVWADLAEIDYRDRPQRKAIADYFCTLVTHAVALGVRGFRCDAAYKVPKDVWRELIGAGRKADENVLFVAENLGSMIEQVEGLRGAGFDYLFNSSKWWNFRDPWLLDQYEKFRSIAPSISFPETHDTERLVADLAHSGVTAPRDVERRCRQAYLFAAIFSAGVMIPIGFEFGFRKKPDVVKTRSKDWEAPLFDLTAYIASVNQMRRDCPVLNEEGPQRAVPLGDGRMIALQRKAMRGADWVVTFINTDQRSPVKAFIERLDSDVREGREITPGATDNKFWQGTDITLDPGEIRVFRRA